MNKRMPMPLRYKVRLLVARWRFRLGAAMLPFAFRVETWGPISKTFGALGLKLVLGILGIQWGKRKNKQEPSPAFNTKLKNSTEDFLSEHGFRQPDDPKLKDVWVRNDPDGTQHIVHGMTSRPGGRLIWWHEVHPGWLSRLTPEAVDSFYRSGTWKAGVGMGEDKLQDHLEDYYKDELTHA